MHLLWSQALLFSTLATCTPIEQKSSNWHWPHWPSWPHHRPHGRPVTTTVDLGYSKYQGIELADGINQWLGMRFAAPPTGDLRWRAPRDPVATKGVQPATQFGPTCLGSGGPGLSNSTNEDCLYLDVFAPAGATTESKLPVWFFIQGGGYAGDTDANFNGTEAILRSNNSMVFVEINYRVGAFGFLASEKIRSNGDLNAGLLDQRKALHWVQKYIHLFGGDPNHVVIHGDSAGGGSIAHQLTAYGGRNDHLFVGAMAESPFWPTQRTVAESEFQFDRFARDLNCSAAPDILKCLRGLDTATVQSADVNQPFPGTTGAGDWYFLPCVDGDFSTDLLYNQFEKGRLVRVPLVVGDDNDEGTAFVPNVKTTQEFLTVMKDNYPNLSDEDLQKINKAYPEDSFPPFPKHERYFSATEGAYGEATFICPGIEMSNSLAKYFNPSKSWNYRWNVQEQAAIDAGLGVPHVVEKPAIFGVDATGPCNGCSYETYNANIVPIMMDYWISFILSLDPNTFKNAKGPVWEPITGGGWGSWWGHHGQKRLKLETNATAMESIPKEQLKRCDLWKELAQATEQ